MQASCSLKVYMPTIHALPNSHLAHAVQNEVNPSPAGGEQFLRDQLVIPTPIKALAQ